MNNTLKSITCAAHFIIIIWNTNLCIRLIQTLYSIIISTLVVLRHQCHSYSKFTLSPGLLLIWCKGSPWSRLFYHQDCFCVVVDTPTFSPKSAPSSIGLFLLFSEPSTLVHRPKHPIQHQLQPPCDKLGHGDRYHCCKSRIWWTAIQVEAIMEDGIASWIKSSTTFDISQQTRRYWAT